MEIEDRLAELEEKVKSLEESQDVVLDESGQVQPFRTKLRGFRVKLSGGVGTLNFREIAIFDSVEDYVGNVVNWSKDAIYRVENITGSTIKIHSSIPQDDSEVIVSITETPKRGD